MNNMYQSVTNFKEKFYTVHKWKTALSIAKLPFFALFYLLLTHCVSRTKDCTKKEVEGGQRYTYRVPQTIQMKLILLSVWAERAVLGSAKTALKFKLK
jgi:hypothetical protein